MARKKNRLVALALLATMAIASLSIGNALWTESLVVNGSAQTGTLNVDFNPAPEAEETDPLNVATCVISAVTLNSFNITVSNAYPGYSCAIDYTIQNAGSIPVSAPSVQFSGVSGTLPTGWFSNTPMPSGIAQGTSETGTATFAVPINETGNEGGSLSATITLTYTQGQP